MSRASKIAAARGTAYHAKHVANQANERLSKVTSERDQLRNALHLARLALEEGLEYVEEPPEKNCSCHVSPPCNDCIDNSGVREFFNDARRAIQAIGDLQ